MFSAGSVDGDLAGHEGYVAGRYRNGAISDRWTDVTRCAERTFVHYVSRCQCGWTGADRSATAAGAAAARREWRREHLLRATPVSPVDVIARLA